MTAALLGPPRRRPVWLLVVLVALLAPPGAFALAPAVTNQGRMSGDTTIQWRGVRGIRLATAPGGVLDERAITLDLRGGTYADVHLVPMPQPIGCADYRMTYCASGAIRLFRPLAAYESHQQPGYARSVLLWDPPALSARWLDLYLFTDGVATLRVRGTGYPGRTSYVATGRVRGELRPLPVGCPAAGGCPVGVVNGGGRELRVGRHGFAMVTAYDGHAPGSPPQPRSTRPCLYPNAYDPAASPRSADHPFGCDPVDVNAPGYSTTGYSFGTALTTAITVDYLERDLSGPHYAGFLAASAPTADRRRGGWVVWFDYGIR